MRVFNPRPAEMKEDTTIDVEEVLSKLNLGEKISLLSGLFFAASRCIAAC